MKKWLGNTEMLRRGSHTACEQHSELCVSPVICARRQEERAGQRPFYSLINLLDWIKRMVIQKGFVGTCGLFLSSTKYCFVKTLRNFMANSIWDSFFRVLNLSPRILTVATDAGHSSSQKLDTLTETLDRQPTTFLQRWETGGRRSLLRLYFLTSLPLLGNWMYTWRHL